MATTVDPLAYHYETGLKLDYFILSIDIAFLGWTVVNTDWLPHIHAYALAMGICWALVVVSIVAGIIRQLYNSRAFGANHLMNYHGELASHIERSVLQSSGFIDQQTGEVLNSQQFKENAVNHRSVQTVAKEEYDKSNTRSSWAANISITLLVVALFLFANIRILTLT